MLDHSSGLRHLSALHHLEELNIAYNCHLNDSAVLGWTTLSRLRRLNLEACSNIANR